MSTQLQPARIYNTYNQPIYNEIMKLDLHPTSRILDVGCGAGNLGSKILEKTTCKFDGIELNQAAKQIAIQTGYENVYSYDLNAKIPDEFMTNEYDVIILADILEHLINPEQLLYNIKDVLSPNGVMYISIPNIAFIYCRLNLLFGIWNYKDYGIMDRTHLRFYTKSTMRSLLTTSNLQIRSELGYCALNNYNFILKLAMRNLAKLLPSLFAMQIIFSVKR